MVKNIKKAKIKKLFKSTFITLLITFGLFVVVYLLFHITDPVTNSDFLLNDILGYGTGISGTALVITIIGLIFPNIRKKLIRV